MAATRFSNLKEIVDCRGNIIALPPDINNITDEYDDSAEILEIPVNVEIITDEDEVEDESEDPPPISKKMKTSDNNSYAVGNAFVCNIENLKKSLKGKSSRECFEEFFTEEVFETIVTETKRYAADVRNKHDFMITVTDVKILLGFMIFAGYHRLPSERDYWSDDEDLGIPLVKAAMTRNAFAELKSCLHFQDNSKVRDNLMDKSFKIRPLMDKLNRNFQKWDIFHESLTMGEMIVPCFGAKKAKQRKSARLGYKLEILCGEGYCYKFWLNCGQQERNAELEPHMVKHLVNPDSKLIHNVSIQNAQICGDLFNNLHVQPELKNEINQVQVLNKKCVGVKYYELLLRKHCIPIRGKKWYWCLITRMIDMAIVNAYHIFRETQDAHKCMKDFRREIAVPYLKLGHCRRITRNLAPNPSRTHVNEDVRFDGLNHIIGKREKQRRCQFQNCKGRPKTYCVKCNITLCTTCFPQFHFR